jgi:hypothetical protein
MPARSNPQGLTMQLSSHNPWLPGTSPSCMEDTRYSASSPCKTAASVGVRSDSIPLAEGT